MRTYLITLKLSRHPHHDPHNKITGPCPASSEGKLCTDVTDQHHTIMKEVDATPEQIATWWEEQGFHVTRIEEV